MTDGLASEQIDAIVNMHGGWKGELLTRLRAAVKAADPDVVEEVKWKMPTRPEGLPVWSHDGMVCFAEIWKDNVKLIFAKGAQLSDPTKLFNARLKSAEVRAIELHEGDAVDEAAIKALYLAAVELNQLK